MHTQEFTDRAAASKATASKLAERIRARLETDGRADIIVSGGSTPAACFETLSRQALDWDRVQVWLSDERWIAADQADSNERMVRETLIANSARNASLIPVYSDTLPIEARCAQLDEEIRSLPQPFAASLLGMGPDGHFASLFPDLDDLQQWLDPQQETRCVALATVASPLPRVSLTMAALTRSDEIVLLVFGDEKRRVFEEACESPGKYPVSSLLRLDGPPVTVYWAP